MDLPDIYFLPEWGRINQELVKGEACIFDFNNKLGHVYYSFIKRKVPDLLGYGTFYDIVTPYGFSGPIILESNKANKELLISAYDNAFKDYCFQENIVAEYVKFNPWLRNHLDFEKIYSLRYNNYTLYIDLTVKDFFMEEFCSKIRTKIRKAENLGVRLEYDYSGTSLSEFYRLYQYTVEKNDVSEYYKFNLDFLTRMFNSLNNRQFLINARFENEYISSAIFMEYGDYLHFHLVANDYRHYQKNANSMIMYEAANWGQNHNKKQMHIGGASTNELYAFKKQFTRKGICDLYIGEKIRNEAIYNKLVDMKLKKGDIKNSSYFPLYRG
jgi:hypothetical protein